MWTSLKKKINDNAEEIAAGAIIVGCVAVYGVILGVCYKQVQQDNKIKKAQLELFKNAIELQVRELNVES